MSPRRNRPRGGARNGNGPATGGGRGIGVEHTEDWRGQEWVVRRVSGAAAAKHYRCPGCDQQIPPGVPHVVTWPQFGDVDDRRHWHAPCWSARDRRTTRVQRSRNAPRY
ncbi:MULTISPECIES: ATP/GTP-binding protein [unclassified Streptomyces]|uniref:ATP/GTP-binding protein n=1 Tax=unclassified Streptomyces TaxID=2593676 RepID=UPI0022B64C51|nr:MULTISPECIES: ATP/GTP-binding protein [unclassified Streptomyces]MCZ7416483.1 ATP/GTP-binding protein [Streptomyces sp. WMMC897]MCZ7433706.1 ATP/GTP-binding protein [Streptomyces sp. WMMC1477]